MAGSATCNDTIQTPSRTWMPQTNKSAVGLQALGLQFQVGCIQGCCLDASLHHQNRVNILPSSPINTSNFLPIPFLPTESKAITIQFLCCLFPSIVPHFHSFYTFMYFLAIKQTSWKMCKLKSVHKIWHRGSKAGHKNEKSSSYSHKQGQKKHAIKS